MTPAEAQKHLEQVKDLQECFKPGVITGLACRIVQKALATGEVWPDEIPHGAVAETDRNCIGSSWRKLVHVGIINRTREFRTSEADDAKGRTIFRYVLADAKLARIFLERNGMAEPLQQEMF